MNNKLDRLNDIKIENTVWIIYIIIIALSYYANEKEKQFILFNDENSKKQYQNLLILIFSVLIFIYYYFVKDSYNDWKDLSIYENKKSYILHYASFIGSLLIFVSGIIFLLIAILDEDIDVELAFN